MHFLFALSHNKIYVMKIDYPNFYLRGKVFRRLTPTEMKCGETYRGQWVRNSPIIIFANWRSVVSIDHLKYEKKRYIAYINVAVGTSVVHALLRRGIIIARVLQSSGFNSY